MQGFNMGRYVPPDIEGTKSGNQINHKRAPGSLRKDGTQTVRFEMPFAVWCHNCKPHVLIPQGVRFNANKKRIGHYYSTPIWEFTIKHTACGGQLDIRTDPQNTAYIVASGGKARDYGDEKVKEGHDGLPILTEAEREQRRNDAFAQLEANVEEKSQAKTNAKRIEELYVSQKRDWNDPWDVNRRMRSTFRRERKEIKREEAATKALKDRIGTDIDILPVSKRDEEEAKLVTFQQSTSSRPSGRSSGRAKSGKALLQQQLQRNTRSAMNPFG